MAKKLEVEKPSESYKKPLLFKINGILALIFYIIWIIVGLFILLSIYSNIRQGAFSGLLNPGSQQAPASPQEPPNEATLPGVGLVKVDCVQNAISDETIQKIVQDGNTDSLTEEEKAKFEPCIVEREPSSSPSPTS